MAEKKTVSNAKTSGQKKTVTDVKTSAQKKSATEAKTTAQKKPATEVKTTAQKKPATEAKATAQKKPATEAKATAQKKPATEAKATAQKKPATEAKATAQKKPATEAKATAQKKSETKTSTAKQTEKPVEQKSTAKVAQKEEIKASFGDRKTTAKQKTETTVSTEEKKSGFGDKRSAVKTSAVAATVIEDNAKKSKDKKTKATKSKENSSEDKNKKKKIYIASIASACIFVVVLGLVLGIVLGTRGGAGKNPVQLEDRYDITAYKTNTLVQYSAEVMGNADRNKPVEGVKDERNAFDTDLFTFDESKRYPTYGSSLGYVLGTSSDKVAARSSLIREAAYLCAWGTRGANNGGEQTADKYTLMDEDGWLYQIKDGQRVHSLSWGTTENVESNYRRLYKHSASEGLYLGNVSDSEQAIVKQLTLRNRSYSSYSVTGVYAPAGEVLKIELSGKDMDATGGITVHIGQALYNGQANNIWTSKNQMQRFPLLLNTLTINKDTANYDKERDVWTGYVGSFIGGPVYIRNTSATFTTTISGGVPYSHFILGYTTQEEFEQNKKSSAPYFDLEVWDRGVLHSGPRKYADSFSYEDLYKAAVLWDKVASVTTTGSNQGIVFVYDPFVAAGAAVAFPGRSSVNCPMGWMPSSLNYDAIVTSGSWGNFHEYHHNFQGYGVGNGGEVTNNGMTLVSYALFTKITSNRGMSNYGAQGLGTGWNCYTSATWALEETLKISRPNVSPSNGNQGLALYATLLHNFGADNYIKAKVAGGGQSYFAYMDAWQKVTHNNMYYYFNDILKGTGITNNANSAYPVFVPVSSVYQTGRSYLYYDETTGKNEKRYFDTMQPYVIPYGDEFTVDLRKYTTVENQYVSGSIIIPDGFSYEITKVTQPQNGTFKETSEKGVYTYKPDSKNSNAKSGKIYVTLKITKDDKSFVVEDVDLALEFEQSHETNKMSLKRTTYTYAEGKAFADAVTAYENGFAGYTDKKDGNHTNPTQNANTDIWFYPNDAATREKYPNAPEEHFAHKNTIEVLDGKLYFEEDGKYRIFLRGRQNCAVYYSLNGKDYKLGAAVKNGSGSGFYTTNKDTYFDVDFNQGKCKATIYVGNAEAQTFEYEAKDGNWVYVKEILIVNAETGGGKVPYIGLGSKQWTELLFSMVDNYYTADKKLVESTDDPNYAYTETNYTNNTGTTVAVAVKQKGSEETKYYKIVSGKRVASTLEEVTALTESKLIAPTSASFVNAYRDTYQFPDNKSFESEYFYVRNYTYNYSNNIWQNKEGQTVTYSNYNSKNSWPGNYPIENLVDGDRNTLIHTNFRATASNPLEFIVDMGEAKSVNRMTMYTQNRSANGDWLVPTDFTLEGSLDGETFFTVGEFTSVPRNGTSITVNFDEKTFRYYRLVITGSTRLIIISEIEMWNIFELNGGKHISPDDSMFKYSGNWYGAQATSNFGHVYVGTKKASVSFEFEGTRLGLFSSDAYGKDYEVIIDGKTVNSIALKEDDFATSLSFLSEELASGKHNVTIKCNGIANIDSFVLYP